jgi:molybdate transport system substrate-binding protein
MRTLVAALSFALAAPAAMAEQVTVFAAASLKTALDAVAADWKAATGGTAALSYGGSSALARQIEAGAPADVFISASPEWMDELDGKGLLEPGTRRDLLGNALVLIAHGKSADPVELAPDFDLAGHLGPEGRLAMAMVDSVPAGQYGKAALTSLGLWDSVAPRVAQADNVRAALALVAAGEAPLGIVYRTDAGAEDNVTIIGTFPENSHPPIVYPIARIRGAGGEAFLDWLAGPAAAARFREAGFRLIE